jgi:hypothetical protein
MNEMVNEMLGICEENRHEMLIWLCAEHPDDIEFVVSFLLVSAFAALADSVEMMHRRSKKLDEVIAMLSMLPQPIAEELAPYIVA